MQLVLHDNLSGVFVGVEPVPVVLAFEVLDAPGAIPLFYEVSFAVLRLF